MFCFLFVFVCSQLQPMKVYHANVFLSVYLTVVMRHLNVQKCQSSGFWCIFVCWFVLERANVEGLVRFHDHVRAEGLYKTSNGKCLKSCSFSFLIFFLTTVQARRKHIEKPFPFIEVCEFLPSWAAEVDILLLSTLIADCFEKLFHYYFVVASRPWWKRGVGGKAED